MDAIEFTETNLPKILQTEALSVAEAQGLTDVFIKKNYVFIRGYYDDRVPLQLWAMMPSFVFEKNFDFDPIQIHTDWDEIVRL